MLIIFANIFFVLLCGLMLTTILIQQSKGGIGFGAAPSKGTEIMFGGSGGQDFFEKATWILAIIFLSSCVGIAYFQSKEQSRSILESYQQILTRSDR